MFKRVNNIAFVFLFLLLFFLPLLFTDWRSGGTSEEENRNLAKFPSLITDNKLNITFTQEFDSWFMDHMGFRDVLITANRSLHEKVFDRSISNSNMKTGRTGDVIYATDEIIRDFAHVNLRTDDDVAHIGQSYQIISDWLAEKNIPFYYVQCVDKHTIYPERFIENVQQFGTVSKTDQVLTYLEEQTSVNAIYFKDVMEEQRLQHNVFSHWGDATHWTPRGAFICYNYMMEHINDSLDYQLKILSESDYDISVYTMYGPDDAYEEIEDFKIRNPKAKESDVSVMGPWATDYRHRVWINTEADNDKRLLLMGDSYFSDYLLASLAESFREVWMVWGDHTWAFTQIVELCNPDIVIYECAERVDRSEDICILAQNLDSAN